MEQSTPILETTPELYRHKKRPEWGLAILTWEGPTRRRFQFQDGQIRTFKQGYYGLLEAVDQPRDVTEQVIRDLKSMLRATREEQRIREIARESGKDMLTLDDQIAVFAATFKGGFPGDPWTHQMRNDPKRNRPLKRHRDAAIAQAAEQLSKKALDSLIAAGDFKAVHQAMTAALSSTNLAGTAREIKPLKDAAGKHHEGLALTLRDLLWGKGGYEQRFDAYVTALSTATSGRVTWAMATALPALVHPEDQVCVHLKTFRQQARWMAPGIPPMATPTALVYKRYLNMAEAIQERLVEAGHKPRDLVDVLDFMIETLRPAARKRAASQR